MNQPTQAQRAAANPSQSVWVTANAGTGKTKVLTDRVLRLLLEGTLPDRILCLTYTRAAAAEMLTRLQAQLAKWVSLADDALHTELLNLTGQKPDAKQIHRARRLFLQVMEAPEGVRILTIHSLCQSLLRRFALEAQVSPYFTVMEESQASQLQQEARRLLFASRTLPHRVEAFDAALPKLAAQLNVEDFDGLLAEIIKQYPQYEEWFYEADGAQQLRQRISTALGCDESETEAQVLADYYQSMQQRLPQLQQLVQAISAYGTKAEKEKALPLFDWLANPQPLDCIPPWKAIFITQKNEPTKRPLTGKIVQNLPDAATTAQTEQNTLLELVEKCHAIAARDWSFALASVAERLVEIYRKLKQQRGLLDYTDLIHRTAKLLGSDGIAPWILFKLDSGIDHLLLDEAQDTSPIQWRIIELLVTEFFSGNSARDITRTLFVVGDEKQSIYGFQGADSQEFLNYRQKFSQQVQRANQHWQKVEMNLSYRSTPAVLKAVDAIFANERARRGVGDSDREIGHQAYRLQATGRVELWPLFTAQEKENTPQPWQVPHSRNARPNTDPEAECARAIARKVSEWLTNKRPLPARNRTIEAGDILILVRSRNPFYYRLLRALKREGVPVAGEDRLKLLEQLAVQDVLAAADFALLPPDDLSLASLLKSPFFDLTEEQLFTLAHGRSGSLWQALQAQHPTIAATLNDWRNKAEKLRPYEFFATLLEGQNGRQKLAAQLGEQVHDPLNALLTFARDYEQHHPPSLQGFMQELRREEITLKRQMEQGGNVVRVMTVHNSKGLQAPIVILPDMTSQLQQKDKIIWSDNAVFYAPSIAASAAAITRLKDQRKESGLNEYRRLFYVALTRAADELYLCGYASKENPREGSWYEMAASGLEAVTTTLENGTRIIADPIIAVEKTPKAHTETQPETQPAAMKPTPKWLTQNAPVEPTPSRPLMPSRPIFPEAAPSTLAISTEATLRGTLLHRLLEILPDVPPSERLQAARLLLSQHAISDATQQEWLQQVQTILEDTRFAPVFSDNSLAEVPITALLPNGQVLSGRIDRMAILPDRILVVDYKTNLSIPPHEGKIPPAIRAQIQAYVQAISMLYPHKKVEAALLWTHAPTLMPLAITAPDT